MSRLFGLMARVVPGAALVVALSGCKDDPGPGKLFEEDGTYELVQFDLDGSGYMEVRVQTADEAFLMKLDAKSKVAQTAMCGEFDTDHPGNSQCRLTPGDSSFWFCHCFAYDFVENQMLWREFEAGTTPPDVDFDGDGGPPPSGETGTGGSGGGTGAVDPAGDTTITLSEIAGVSGEYEFTPLPVGVFGSDGLTSRYRFQQRAPSLFNQVYEDPDGRTGCEPCVP